MFGSENDTAALRTALRSQPFKNQATHGRPQCIKSSYRLLGVGLLGGIAAYANPDEGPLDSGHPIKHVLLISVDGLHALDLSNYVATHPDSTLADLSRHGVTYTNNSTSSPSDSFPGLASLVTGGSPVTTGLWYDDTYNRALSPPASRRPRQSRRQLPRQDRHECRLGRSSG